MKKIVIKPKYEYWYFETQKDFFNEVEKFLLNGFKITDSILSCVELTKEDYSYLLSYVDIEEVDENIKETIRADKLNYKLVKPNYNKCILNTIASIRKYFNKSSEYLLDNNLEKYLNSKKYDNIIIMLIDGLGENILDNNLSKTSFLKSHHAYTNTAIFPSTTAAATTATKCGLTPIRTGWLGWENYFSEIDKNLILFNGKEYVSDELTGFNTYSVLPYKPFYFDLDVEGKLIEPDFTKIEHSFDEVLEKSLANIIPNKNNVQYVYYSEPDGMMHKYGAFSDEAVKILEEMEVKISDYASKLPEKTLLIITADHGHTDVKPIDLYTCHTINKMLERRPSNDSRCITFKVKKEYKKEFENIFNSLFGYAYQLYSKEELLDLGFFGKPEDPKHFKVDDFLADYIAIATNQFYFNYKGENNTLFKSHHAGMTADEMFVPVIIYEK